MSFLKQIQDLQKAAINEGWRIKEITWTEPGKMEVIAPKSKLSIFFLSYGILGFFGGLILCSVFTVPGLVIAGSGLISLLLTNLTMAKNTYKNFKPVEARCLDQEIRYFEQTSKKLHNTSNTRYQWVIRLLCEYGPEDKPIRVTPIIPNSFAFTSQEACIQYLQERIKDKQCRLWVDPKNPLHTSFHDKPKFQMRGNS